MGPLCPQGRFPLSRVDIISSKPLPARGLMGPSLPVVPAPPRLASGCQSGVAACCLASPLRRRGPPGLPVCRSGCAGPAAVACPLPPSRMRGPGDDGLLFRMVKPSYRCTPAAALPWPLRSEGMARAGSGAAVPPLAGTCITWAAPSFHDQNVLGRNFSCMLKEQLLPENYTGWQIIPVTWAGPPREPTGRATAQPAGFLPGTLPQ